MKLSRSFGTGLLVPTGQVFLKAILAAATYPHPAGKRPTAQARRRVLLRASYLYEACLLEHDLLSWPPSQLAAAAALLALRRQATGSVDSSAVLLRRVDLNAAGTCAAFGAMASDSIGRRLRRPRPSPAAAAAAPPAPIAPAESVWTSSCEAVSGYREVELLELITAIVAEVMHVPRSTAHGRILQAVKKKYSHLGRSLAVATEAPLAVQHHATTTVTTATGPQNSESGTSREPISGGSTQIEATRRRSSRERVAVAAAAPADRANQTRNRRPARQQNSTVLSPERETQSTVRRSQRGRVT